MRSLLAACLVAVLPLPCLMPVAALGDETIMMPQDGGGLELGNGAADCGCRNVQRPPWHGNVQPADCGPPCHGTGRGMFHANPCNQLHLRRYARENCMTMPPCFPRLHAWCAEGAMPTPPPPAMPRCHQCGAAIDGGF